MNRKPLRIGLSPRFLHPALPQLGFRGKTLQYLEQSVAHWLMSSDAIVFMIPSITGGGLLRRVNIRTADYAAELDGLVLQGGADVSPLTYGETPARKEWGGDRIRDMYEIDLLQAFASAGKPVLGICRGLQLINVAFGGTLYQDLALYLAQAAVHHNPDAYDQHFHEIALVPGTGLACRFPGVDHVRVNSIHHQGIRVLGKGLVCEAVSVPDKVIEAVRWRGPNYVLGVQWHPEFHDPGDASLLNGDPILEEFLGAAHLARDAVK